MVFQKYFQKNGENIKYISWYLLIVFSISQSRSQKLCCKSSNAYLIDIYVLY